MNDHKQLLQPRQLANISTASIDVNSSGRMSPGTKQVPLTLGASGPVSTASPPSKQLRTEHYCSSKKSSSHKHTCGNYVKAVCSQEEETILSYMIMKVKLSLTHQASSNPSHVVVVKKYKPSVTPVLIVHCNLLGLHT